MSDKKIAFKIINKKELDRKLSIEVLVEKKELEKFRNSAFKKISENVEIKGFRKGMAPEKLVIGQIGEMKVTEEQAYQAINSILPILVEQEKIEAITHPEISITKISPIDNLEFKTTFILMPTVELPDYKSIAKGIKKKDDVKVTKKEIDDYIEYIRKNRAESEYIRRKTSGENLSDSEKNNLPEFNDDFVKSLGNFKSVVEFKDELEKNMNDEKINKEKNRRRTEIIEKIIDESKIELPEILVHEELERMLHQYESDIQRIGIKFEDYLKEIKKTVEDLKKEWRTDAVKRAKMNLIMPKIAIAENIKPNQDRIEHEMKHIVEHHKDVDLNHARSYFNFVLTNEAVFEFLETL